MKAGSTTLLSRGKLDTGDYWRNISEDDEQEWIGLKGVCYERKNTRWCDNTLRKWGQGRNYVSSGWRIARGATHAVSPFLPIPQNPLFVIFWLDLLPVTNRPDRGMHMKSWLLWKHRSWQVTIIGLCAAWVAMLQVISRQARQSQQPWHKTICTKDRTNQIPKKWTGVYTSPNDL